MWNNETEADMVSEFWGQAVADGSHKENQPRIESALDPLRSREDLHRMMRNLAFPTKTFVGD